MERDDSANLFVLEGVLIALILLGAAYTVQSLQETATHQVRPRTELTRLTGDALIVLEGLHDGNGTSLLDLYMAEQYHCALDAVAPAGACDLRRSKNLSIKVENYLPLGSGWALEVGNGAETRELYRSPIPQGEAVAASLAFGPEWNLTFAITDLSCYQSDDAVNAVLIPIDRGAYPWTRWGNVTVDAAEFAGARPGTDRWWNVTLPAASRPASGTLVANVTGNATLEGSTAYAACDLDDRTAALRTALAAAPASVPNVAPIGSLATFSVDVDALDDIDEVEVTSVAVTIYEPLPAHNGTADSAIVAGAIALDEGSDDDWAGSWLVPGHTLYGAHPVVLRIVADVDGTTVELRRVATIDIALASGEVPIDPPYRAILQTWLGDWG